MWLKHSIINRVGVFVVIVQVSLGDKDVAEDLQYWGVTEQALQETIITNNQYI